MDIYCDGSSIESYKAPLSNSNGKQVCFPSAGWGVWCNQGKSMSGHIPFATNQVAELKAMTEAVRFANNGDKILSDSAYCISWATGKYKICELSDKKKSFANAFYVKNLLSEVSKKKLTFEHVKGHSSNPGNDAADKLATEAANKGYEMSNLYFLVTSASDLDYHYLCNLAKRCNSNIVTTGFISEECLKHPESKTPAEFNVTHPEFRHAGKGSTNKLVAEMNEKTSTISIKMPESIFDAFTVMKNDEELAQVAKVQEAMKIIEEKKDISHRVNLIFPDGKKDAELWRIYSDAIEELSVLV